MENTPDKEEQKRVSTRKSEAKSPPGTPQRRSTKQSLAKEEEAAAVEDPEESPQPEVTEGAEEGAVGVEGAAEQAEE